MEWQTTLLLGDYEPRQEGYFKKNESFLWISTSQPAQRAQLALSAPELSAVSAVHRDDQVSMSVHGSTKTE
jgi:hypothetical protein